MPLLEPLRWALGAVTALLVGFSKLALPGIAVVYVPIFAEVLPARASTGALLPLLILGDVLAVAYWRRHAAWRHLVRLLPWTLGGIVAGWLAMGAMDDRLVRRAIGALLIVVLAVAAWRDLRRASAARRGVAGDETVPSASWFAGLFGLAGGFTSMVSNAAGALLVVYLLAMKLPRDEFIGTSAWYFLIVNVVKVPFSVGLGLITGPSLLLDAALAIGVAAGALAGMLAARRIPERVFTVSVQVLAFAAAVRMLL
jgi:uncharacterized membrane protein YfcA